MCYYDDVLGQGAALVVQLITFAAIILSIAFWVWMYRKQTVSIRRYIVPIALWVAFGTLDILITARGTMGNPMLEDNPFTREILLLGGYIGPAIASVLWVSLWAFIVLMINKWLKSSLVEFTSLAVFYSLAIGHLLGFSSWFAPLCVVSSLSWAILPNWLIRIPGLIAMGCAFAAIHSLANRAR